MMMKKTVIHVDAALVDAANDSVKLLVVLLVSMAYSRYLAGRYGLGSGGFVSADTGLRWVLTTTGVVAAGLALYHVLVEKLIVFMPQAGQASYYMSLKRS